MPLAPHQLILHALWPHLLPPWWERLDAGTAPQDMAAVIFDDSMGTDTEGARVTTRAELAAALPALAEAFAAQALELRAAVETLQRPAPDGAAYALTLIDRRLRLDAFYPAELQPVPALA